MLTVRPATANVAVRAEAEFAAAAIETVPAPVPLSRDAVIQAGAPATVHEQPGAAVIVRTADPPAAGNASVAGLTV